MKKPKRKLSRKELSKEKLLEELLQEENNYLRDIIVRLNEKYKETMKDRDHWRSRYEALDNGNRLAETEPADNETPKFPEDLGTKLTPASDFGTPVKDVICFPLSKNLKAHSREFERRRREAMESVKNSFLENYNQKKMPERKKYKKNPEVFPEFDESGEVQKPKSFMDELREI